MKKVIMIIFVFMFLVMPVKAYADSAAVEVIVNGEVTKGSIIEILVNVKDVEKFYAASVDFTYDVDQLKVESINASEFITSHSNDIMELGGETDKNGNTASYSFTFLGEKDGIKGTGTLAIITAQVLNDENLSIGQDNMRIKLVQRVGDDVENYSYKFNGYNISQSTDTFNNDVNNKNDLNDNESSTSNDKNVTINDDSSNNISTNSSDTSNNSESYISEEKSTTNTDESNINKGDSEENDASLVGISTDEDNNINDTDKKDKEEVTDESTLAIKTSNMVISVIVVVCIIAVIGGIVYYLYLRKNKK